MSKRAKRNLFAVWAALVVAGSGLTLLLGGGPGSAPGGVPGPGAATYGTEPAPERRPPAAGPDACPPSPLPTPDEDGVVRYACLERTDATAPGGSLAGR